MQPDSKQPVYHIRLQPNDRAMAVRMSRKLGIPTTTWIRLLVHTELERYRKEQRDAK